jgi:predicted Fe-Mo cluster-binding NifX family protein
MRIAVSIWEDKVSPVFDTASKLMIIESENQQKSSRYEAYLLEEDLLPRCSFLRGLALDVLICGAVSRQLSGMLMSTGINVISGISGPADDVIEAYLQGNLLDSKYFMPGHRHNPNNL